ncbi:unnamed protein product [Protopolystoma xenopodis]|uniref:DOP1 N-terminal domain-containing protein n=1 Tax=Protopolystoma xenopodis TaxID=117903 RepID=A0A448WHT5_9PLAT|nr:unnamed protein product [Protopolystoma xenopodis]
MAPLTMPAKDLEMYPANGPMLEITNTMAEDTGLVVTMWWRWRLSLTTPTNCLLAGLQCLLCDAVLLVQRDALDFLCLALPLHSIPACQLSPAERGNLFVAVLSTLLRRDASLNRRVYAWLLGIGSQLLEPDVQ